MDRLILLRHGKADAEAPSGQDFDRALTDRGRRDTVLVCRTLALAGVRPDLALVSPAARTMQTWQAAEAIFPGAKLEVVPALYDIAPHELLTLIRNEAGASRTVMVVGHNPGLGALAAHLAREAGADVQALAGLGMGFPTAAAAEIQFDPPSFALHTPKALGGGV